MHQPLHEYHPRLPQPIGVMMQGQYWYLHVAGLLHQSEDVLHGHSTKGVLVRVPVPAALFELDPNIASMVAGSTPREVEDHGFGGFETGRGMP